MAVAVAVAERVDVVDAREKTKGVLHSTVLVPCVADVEAIWPLKANANDVGVG